eukprot:scaffold38083_cov51-Attheya_sp.AAC.1
MNETEVNEVVEYRIRFRAPNKPNTDKLGVGVYELIEEDVLAPEIFASFMEDVHVPLRWCPRSIARLLQRWRHCADCIVRNHNLKNRSEAPKGFVFPSEMDNIKMGRVMPDMLGVLLTTPDSFATCNMRGNLTSKTMSKYRFSEMVDTLVEHMFGKEHDLYEENIVKYMTTTAQAQNLAYFIRSSVCAIILEKEDMLKQNRSFVKVVAALTQWTSDGIEVANEKDSTLKADLNAVTMYNKRGMHMVLTHRCIKTINKCSIDIQRKLANKAKRLQNGESVQKIPTVYRIENFDDENENTDVETFDKRGKKRKSQFQPAPIQATEEVTHLLPLAAKTPIIEGRRF